MVKGNGFLIKNESSNIYNAYYLNHHIAIINKKVKNDNVLLSFKILKNKYNDLKTINYLTTLLSNYLFNHNINNIYIKSNKKINLANKISTNPFKSKSKNLYLLTKDNFYFLNKYDTILLDIDDTLLSFKKAERNALTKSLNKIGVKANDKLIEQYHQINISYWHKVEKNLISKDECLILRFKEFLSINNINYDPFAFEDIYRDYLNMQAFLVKNARKVLTYLSSNYKIYAITNGVKLTQQKRMKKAKLNQYFIKTFISEEIGYEKPSIKFIENVKNEIKDFDVNKTLIVGDSLTSDIKLGINSNIDTCWFNIHNVINNKDIESKYVIYYIDELLIH